MRDDQGAPSEGTPTAEPRKAGRPTKATRQRFDQILLGLRNGNTRTAAVLSVGIDYQTFLNWLERYSDFSAEVEQAEATAERAYVTVLANAAQSGDWRAAIAWLERRRGKEWRRRTDLDITSGDQPLKVTEMIIQLTPGASPGNRGSAGADDDEGEQDDAD